MDHTLPDYGPYALPLSGLSWFHAVARCGSFTAAAEVLGVSQSAVSHRIRELERGLGLSLLRRTTRRLALTPDGEQLYASVDRALAGIGQTLADLHARHETGILRVQVLSSLALRWLIPRLPGFHDQHPGLRVHLEADDRLSDLSGVDVAIRFGTGGQGGEYTRFLVHEDVFPVCSPTLSMDPSAGVTALADQRQLYDSTGERDGSGFSWRHWFDQTGLAVVEGRERMAFGRADMVLLAAVAGQGVALGRSLLVVDDMAAGRLRAPWGRAVRAGFDYYAVMRPEVRGWPKAANFVDWLAEEMRASYHLVQDYL